MGGDDKDQPLGRERGIGRAIASFGRRGRCCGLSSTPWPVFSDGRFEVGAARLNDSRLFGKLCVDCIAGHRDEFDGFPRESATGKGQWAVGNEQWAMSSGQ